MPAAQLELSLPPARSVPEAIAALAGARRDLAAAAEPIGRLAAAGVHPFAAAIGKLNPGERYAPTEDEYGDVARRQLVCALQVHVAVGGADRSLAVSNRLRPWLPLMAALAANAPFYEGRDTGMASIRPKIGEQLPRQGIPPAIGSWDAFADALAWGAASGAVPEPRRWWWELRPHPAFGTLELRVPDAQATVEDAAAVAALAHALIGWLAARHDAGDPLETADTWRLEENRWSAARWGMDAELADLASGARTPARELLAGLLAELAPVADQLGCGAELATVETLAARNGAVRQREAAAGWGGVRAVAAWLADTYVPSADYAMAAPGT
jgi:glutamate---cysteine ligase / carboxylate-amine ligase